MSTLSTKILSCSPEVYYRFNQAYTLTPTNSGSTGSSTFTLTNEAPILNSTGGVHGEGSWIWNVGNGTNDTTTTMYRNFQSSTYSNANSQFVDNDFSFGYWFKTNFTLTNSATHPSTVFLTQNGGNTVTRVINVNIVGGSANAANKGKIQFLSSGGTTITSSNRVDDQQWHYVAIIGTPSGSNIIYSCYLDGVSLGTISPTATTSGLTYTQFGTSTQGTQQSELTTIEFSDYYSAPSSSINSTKIAEIWAAGQNAVSISYTAQAMTAEASLPITIQSSVSNLSILSSALTASCLIVDPSVSTIKNVDFSDSALTASAQSVDPSTTTTQTINIISDPFIINPAAMEPTIITTTFENVQVATTIPVSAEIVTPLITTDKAINLVLTMELTATADIVGGTFSQTADAHIVPVALEASALSVDPSSIIANRQVSVVGEAMLISALMVDPPLIISDNAAIVYADIMSASCEIPNPGYGTPAPDPLFWRTGTLKSKIATYAIQDGTEFNWSGPYTTIPSYGTYPTGWTSYSLATGAPASAYSARYNASDGPYASGTGCWELHTASRMMSSLDTTITSDLNYGLGIWFKLKTLPTGTANEGARLFTLGTSTVSSTSIDFSVSITGSSHATAPSKLALSLNGSTYDYFGSTMDSEWHYLSIRRTGSTGVNNFEVYIDGQLKLVKTNSDTSTTYNRFHIGNNAVSTGCEVAFQNFHIATAATLTSYEIDQIWQAGTKFPPAASVNVSHASDRFLATALSTSPTVIAIKGDHVEITTSVEVSSVFPEPSWSTGEIVRFNVGSLGTILATIGDNISIETNGDKSITPEPLLANAIIREPILARNPFVANASLPMPRIYTAPNYFQMVMNQEPVFYIEDGQATPRNYGSWQVTDWRKAYVDTNVQSTLEMNAVGNQKSWMGNANGVILHRPELQANVPDYQTKINDLYATKNLSIEIWYKSIGWGNTVNHLIYEESGPIFNDGITQITEVWDWFGCIPGSDPTETIVLIAERVKNYKFDSPNDFAVWRTYPDANPKRDQWNHLVVTYESVTNPDQVRRKIYLNGGIVGNQLLTVGNSSLNPSGAAFTDDGYIGMTLNQPQNIWSGPQIGGGVQLSGSQTIKLHDGVLVDEFAIYPKTLSGTQVVEHYNFIKNLSPDTKYFASAINAEIHSGNHQVLPVQNTLYDEDPMPALAARIPEPIIIGGKSKQLNVDASEFSATVVSPTIITNSIIYVDPINANANMEQVYVASNIYYNYVKTIPNLHRYYSFDTSAPLTNHGTDTTYSVPDITIGGQIVQYGQSINNKSAMTAGTNPETDGVILWESQHDDSWGSVGNGNFFTSFWMERPYFDSSGPGLRMVANINSPSNNHYVLLYQYAGQLWLDAYDGTNLHRQSTTTNPALYGYGTHNVVVAFDNSNQNARHIYVYVDGVEFINASIGSMNLDFVNGGTDAPNDSNNNYKRMSIGSLITPFNITSLPVYPSNIRATVDEIIWANTTATPTIVANLYGYMPTRVGSFNEVYVTEASCESVDVVVSTGTTITTEAMLAFPAQTEPSLYTELFVNVETDTFDATADINDAERSDGVIIFADVNLATAAFGSTGTPRIVNATPLTTSITLVNRTVTGVQTGLGNGILINGQRTFDPNSKWVQYVVSTTENNLIPMREVR